MNFRLVFLVTTSMFIVHSCNKQPKTYTSETRVAETLVEQLKIEIHDPLALTLIDPNATVEILAKGFNWTEGPLWVDELQAVIFSDIPANKIYKWSEKDSIVVFLEYAGHTGEENKDSGKGSNGLILDLDNNLVLCQHGDRRIARLNTDLKNPRPQFITIADSYQDRKFNSPNDLAIDRAGNIYFTDPPYGQIDNKTGEIGINGVFKIGPDNEVVLLVDSLSWPNGIALSLDQQTLYINQSDPEKPVLYSYDISENGSLVNQRTLFDFTSIAHTSNGLPDGLKVHNSGNIFATGPGGVHILSPEGKPLATIKTAKVTANCTFDSEQKYLYMTATDMLIRVGLK